MDIKDVLLLLGGLVGLVLFYKKKADNAKADAITSRVAGEDKILKENQEEARRKIQESDDSIEKLKAEREHLRHEYEKKTKEERAADWNKKND